MKARNNDHNLRRVSASGSILQGAALFALLAGVVFAAQAGAGGPPAGKKLHDEKCVACHVQKSPFGDGDAIYRRSDSTVKSYQRLTTMVSLCNSELRLDLFPEDEQELVEFLNQTYYRLPKP